MIHSIIAPADRTATPHIRGNSDTETTPPEFHPHMNRAFGRDAQRSWKLSEIVFAIYSTTVIMRE